MKYLHTMLRVTNIEASLKFFCQGLGLIELNRYDNEAGRFTLVFLAAPNDETAQVELTYNWDESSSADKASSANKASEKEILKGGRNFGHLAYSVNNIYQTCQHLQDQGITINRPPRDGRMAFVKSPDGISVELLQSGNPLTPQAPWQDLPNIGEW